MRCTIGMIALLATFACGDETLGDLPTGTGSGEASGSGDSNPEDGDSDSSGPGDTGDPVAGAVGTRCAEAGGCNLDLECFTEFTGERPVCTSACDDDSACPEGSTCVVGIPDYRDGTPPLPGYCMRSCTITADCEAFGSVCDAVDDVEGRYCF